MNEFSNFKRGEIFQNESCNNHPRDRLKDEYPFDPSGGQGIDEKTLSLDAYHYAKADAQYIKFSESIREWDFHNLNGFLEGVATNKAQKRMGRKQPFTLSRSSFAGAGRYVAHVII